MGVARKQSKMTEARHQGGICRIAVLGTFQRAFLWLGSAKMFTCRAPALGDRGTKAIDSIGAALVSVGSAARTVCLPLLDLRPNQWAKPNLKRSLRHWRSGRSSLVSSWPLASQESRWSAFGCGGETTSY